jgi:hypothetical protein
MSLIDNGKLIIDNKATSTINPQLNSSNTDERIATQR